MSKPLASKEGCKIRVTVLLGAGASIEVGGPTTSQITEAAQNTIQKIRLPNHADRFPILNEITQVLKTHYKETATFEDVFHALELLQSFLVSDKETTVKYYKSAMPALFQLRSEFTYDPAALRVAKQDILNIIADFIENQMKVFDPSGKHSWFSGFWNVLSNRADLDIATLNYDNTVEQSFKSETLYDGFERLSSTTARFNPKKFFCAKKSKIGHLHGSVLYGYPWFEDPNRFVFEDNHEDLYKFSTSQAARKTWFGRSINYSQSGEEAIIGPVITGLRKTDKTTSMPYIQYRNHLCNSLQKNSRLLIVGYSFGDIYLNRLLERIVQIHGDQRRVAIVDYFPTGEREWHSDPEIMNWPEMNTFNFVAKVFRENRPFHTYSFQSPILSNDKCARLYLRGFKKEVVEKGEEVIEFLTN